MSKLVPEIGFNVCILTVNNDCLRIDVPTGTTSVLTDIISGTTIVLTGVCY